MTSIPLVFNSIVKSKNLFFDIYETPLLYKYPIANDDLFSFPEKKIIVNQNTNLAISIVGEYFKPVLHKQAFHLGIRIFETLFGVTPTIHKESMNANTTDYSVDFVSEKCKIIFDVNGYYFSNDNNSSLFGSRSNQLIETIAPPSNQHSFISSKFYDEYHPFIRVSNFLRSGESFKIELGYYRYRCSNGLMMGRRTKFTFKHSYRKHFYRIEELAIDQFLHSKTRFIEMGEKLWRLLNIPIPKAKMRLVAYDIFEKELIKKSVAERQKLQVELSNLVDKYVDEIGENLNAAINVATDFSKHFESGKVSNSSIQELATTWINKAVKKTFNVQAYLDSSSIIGIEERILNAKLAQEEEEEVEIEL